MRLLFKFKTSAPARDRERVFSHLRKLGVSAVEPLFPDTEDEALAAVFMLDTEDESLLPRLQRERAVEYVEPEVRRKLVS